VKRVRRSDIAVADPPCRSEKHRRWPDFASTIRKYTPRDADIDAVIDVRAIVQRNHRELAATLIPPFLIPQKGRYGLRDYEKLFCAELRSEDDIFERRGIDRKDGCIVVVRPDQFVANVLPLDGVSELAAFFDRFMIASRSSAVNVPA